MSSRQASDSHKCNMNTDLEDYLIRRINKHRSRPAETTTLRILHARNSSYFECQERNDAFHAGYGTRAVQVRKTQKRTTYLTSKYLLSLLRPEVFFEWKSVPHGSDAAPNNRPHNTFGPSFPRPSQPRKHLDDFIVSSRNVHDRIPQLWCVALPA
jgi:hypothetical protein